MPRFKLNDTLVLNGRRARVVWFMENPNEIQAMDEYIVEFDDKERHFFVSSELEESYLRQSA
jgi:hypothetical protein